MGSGTSTVVPANRLGQLLAEARLRQGTDLEELSARSDFTVGELSDFEAGHRVLNDNLVSRITTLYAIDCGPIIPQRAELTIDLTDNVLSASGHALPLESAAHDHVLERYLSLVYVLRNREPGATVPLRDEDVAILAASLAERSELIEEQLLAAMYGERNSVNGLVSWLRQRLWVPGAGAIVGAVSIGTLVMVSSDGSATGADTVDLPEPETDQARPSSLILPARFAGSASPSTTDTAPSEGVTGTSLAPGATTASTDLPIAETTSEVSLASPQTTSVEQTPGSVGAEAEDLLPFAWQQALPGWTITYSGSNTEFRGLTYPYDKSIELYVRDDDTPLSLAGILAHEIGHAIDVTHLKDEQRDSWTGTRSIESSPWWPDAYASDFETGAGDFAEAFAFWAVGDPSSSRIAHEPTTSQLLVLEGILVEVLPLATISP